MASVLPSLLGLSAPGQYNSVAKYGSPSLLTKHYRGILASAEVDSVSTSVPPTPANDNSTPAVNPYLGTSTGIKSEDTLFDASSYTDSPLGAPEPYFQRVENDILNPVVLSPEVQSSALVMAVPTLDPLLYSTTILAPTDEMARDIYTQITTQFSQQKDPLYLLYGSKASNIPRILTKDSILKYLDIQHARETLYQPIPLVSLPLPTVIATPFEADLGPQYDDKCNKVGAFVGLFGISQVPLVHHFKHSLNNVYEYQTYKNHSINDISRLASSRTFFSFTSAGVGVSMAQWVGFLRLREYYLKHMPLPERGDTHTVYSHHTKIASTDSTIVYDLPLSTTLNAPPLYQSPIQRALASVSAAGIVGAVAFPLNTAVYYSNAHRMVRSSMGHLDDNYKDSVTRNPPLHQFWVRRPKSDTKIPIATRPLYGIVDKRLYETFMYDHASRHAYLDYFKDGHLFQRDTPTSYQRLKKWLNKPTAEYTEIIKRWCGPELDLNAPADKKTPRELWLEKLAAEPPVLIENVSQRLRHLLKPLLGTVALWSHLLTGITAYEHAKDYFLNIATYNEFTNTDKNITTKFSNTIQHNVSSARNLSAPVMASEYAMNRYRIEGDIEEPFMMRMYNKTADLFLRLLHGKDSPYANNRHTSQSLQSVQNDDGSEDYRHGSTDRIAYADILYRTHPSQLPPAGSRFFFAACTGFMASIASAPVFHILANTGNRALIRAITSYKPTLFAGIGTYTARISLLHAFVLGAIAYLDHHKYVHSIIQLHDIYNRKTIYANELTQPTADGPFPRPNLYPQYISLAEEIDDELEQLAFKPTRPHVLVAQSIEQQDISHFTADYEKEITLPRRSATHLCKNRPITDELLVQQSIHTLDALSPIDEAKRKLLKRGTYHLPLRTAPSCPFCHAEFTSGTFGLGVCLCITGPKSEDV